ncbi:CHAT domain-containing protein [Streptomyces sp. NPDC001595]|uniref:CHAT domain-containing protein n=1 Tax=Streptomyces sp. NPDC001532 TaxID=3154520 RepID=UPI00333064EE
MTSAGSSGPRRQDRRLRLAREWDEVVARARRLDGFADFLRPPRLASVMPALADGPAVVLNVSRYRCDALVVRTDGVELVPLPGLTAEEAVSEANAHLAAVRETQEAIEEFAVLRAGFEAGELPAEAFRRYHEARVRLDDVRRSTEARLAAVARWMWDAVAEPVLDAVGLRGRPTAEGDWPLLKWCPTGPFTTLPLHAAGHHGAEAGRSVLDRVVSSYTPTLRALVAAGGAGPRGGTRPVRGGNDGLLLVSVPEVAGQVQLAGVTAERGLLERLLPTDMITVLHGADATRARVLAELPHHRWVHFSCHGDQDVTDPGNGGLLLHDGRLTVTELAARGHPADFAFLSACKTATGGIALADEVVSLAAALRFTGYRHVLATLWSVYDTAATDVVADVYAALVSPGGGLVPERSAQALHRAVRGLRDTGPLSSWVPFVHIGP